MIIRKLQWPLAQPRYRGRIPSRYRVPMLQCVDQIEDLLTKLRAKKALLSLDVEMLRRNVPHVNPEGNFYYSRREPGVALYCTMNKQSCVFACDRWTDMVGNLRAIYVTLHALFQMERAGASQLAEQAYKGFAALGAPPCEKQPWAAVLGVDEDASMEEIKKAYRAKAHGYHPDLGGSNEDMAKLTNAYHEALKERGQR